MITPGGEYKSWGDMTPGERHRDRLRHFLTLLGRWRGARATLWELTVSLKTLTIRIERKGVRGNLHVACLGPTYIRGPVYWQDCDVEVAPADDGSFVVRDTGAGLEVHAHNVEVKENCEPVYTPA